MRSIKRLKLKIMSIILLITILTLEVSPLAVKAAAQELNFYSPGSISVGYDTYNGKNVWYSNTTLGGITSYCIDYSYYAPSGTMRYSRMLSDQGLAILLNGYPNTSASALGCASNEEAYMATQMALWQVLNETKESKKTAYPFDVNNIVPISGKEGFYQRAVAGARKLIAIAKANPYSHNPVLNVTTTNARKSQIGEDILLGPYNINITGITDIASIRSMSVTLEGAPSSARITDANGNTKNSVSNGDNVYVRMSTKEKTTSFKVRFSAEIERKFGSIYSSYDSNAQDYVILDSEPQSNSEAITINWTNDDIYGEVEIVKVDQNETPVVGATFRLEKEDGTVVMPSTKTGSDGKIIIKKLEQGKYVLVEEEAPTGYIIKNKTTNVTVKPREKTEVKVVNEKTNYKGEIIIVKSDENSEPVEGAKFNIYDSEGNFVCDMTTNAKGRAGVKNLPLGTYYYQEVEVPEGYQIDNNKYEFKLETDGQTIIKEVVNEHIKGKLKIVKVDENSKPISGVKFNILDTNKKVVDTIVTDNNGIATTKDLLKGTYYYQEVEVPEGYIIDKAEHEFNITTMNQVVEKTVVNNQAKGKLKIIKYDGNLEYLAGVKFNILDKDKKVVDTIITGKDGVAESKMLPLGTYYYQEIEAPENVKIDKELHSFSLTENNQTIVKNVVNKFIHGKLKIIKVDENSKPLAGVKFNILDKNKTVIDTMVTNSEGIAESKELEKGTYYFQEIEAPKGIVVDDTIYEFTIEYDGQNVIKNIKNNFARGSIVITKKDNTGRLLENVKFEILNEAKEVVAVITTNKDGVARLDGLLLGLYFYREISAPDNVVMDTELHEFNVSENEEVIKVEVINKLKEGKLKIIKVDENNKPLAGVKFNILDMDKNIVDTIVTNAEGIAESKELEKGKYYYQEVEAPEGIIVDSTLYEFEIVSDGQNVIKNMINYYAKGSLRIEKYDSKNNTLANVKFEILDSENKVVDTIVTDKNGVAESKKLPLGTYYYQEVEAPDNVTMDTEKHEFVLTENNQVITKKIVNELKEGKLKIIKVDENNKPLAGVKFNILDMDKNIVDTIVTNAEGIAESKELEKGKYYYQEVEAPEGIIVDSTLYEFEIVSDGQNVIKNMINYYAKGSLRIEKYDSKNRTLANVKFEILDSENKVVDTIVTDKNGVAESKKLPLGTYYYQEVEAPDNVTMDTEKHAFALTENNQVITKKIVNELKEGKLKIIKVDENNKPLAGVKFNILDMDKNIVDTIVTNAEGIAESKELEKGKYYYQEIEAPEGIIVDSTLYEFEIEYDGQNVIKNMINYYVKGKLQITKLVEGKNETLANVKFNILDEQRNVIDTIVTDENGLAVKENLPYGTYYFKEVEAPQGYIMDKTEHKFTIDSQDDIVEAVIYNKEEKIPVTGGKISSDAQIVLVISMITIFGYCVISLLRKEENEI